jgi:hypothetical protein
VKIFIVIITAIALQLLYRIAFHRRVQPQRSPDVPGENAANSPELIRRTSFARPVTGRPQPTSATEGEVDSPAENPHSFALGKEKKSAVIPPGELGAIFADEPDPNELEIDSEEENEEDIPLDEEEESEELRQLLGEDAEQPASGFSLEEMEEAAKAVNAPQDSHAALLYRVEKTDMFEQLVHGDGDKATRIKDIIDTYIRRMNPDAVGEEQESNSDWVQFDVMDFLS